MNVPKLTLYYDGLCPLCSREIEHYRGRVVDTSVAFEDITAPGFDAHAKGLDPLAIHRVMHVRTDSGEICMGLEAFVAIWQAIPGYGWLARLASLPIMHTLMELGYRAFARMRRWLPRRKRAECAEGACKV